jgi:hypothetical protein
MALYSCHRGGSDLFAVVGSGADNGAGIFSRQNCLGSAANGTTEKR